MESVTEKIRQARETKMKRQLDANTTETIVDGCHVKMRFDTIGNNNAIATIQSMLVSSYLDSAIIALVGGETCE